MITANQEHNVPDNSQQQQQQQQSHNVHQSKLPYTRSASMTCGDMIASTSDQSSTGVYGSTGTRKSKQRKSESSSSSPALSPSYIQNKRTNMPRNVDLIESKRICNYFPN